MIHTVTDIVTSGEQHTAKVKATASARLSRHTSLVSLVFLVLFLGMSNAVWGEWDGSTMTQPSGAGTQASPYLITTGAELAWFGNDYKDRTYWVKITEDIDLSGKVWPYGSGKAFKGHIVGHKSDGTSPTISNYKLNIPNASANYGLISNISNGSIEGVNVNNVTITYTGGRISVDNVRSAALVGYLSGSSTMTNCSAQNVSISYSGTSKGSAAVGSLVAYSDGTTVISNCTTSGCSVTISGDVSGGYIGGLVGSANSAGASVTNCSTTDFTVTANGGIIGGYIGGFMGYVAGAVKVSQCTSTDFTANINKNVTGTGYIGGLIGLYSTISSISQCSATNPTININANVTAGANFGGLIGLSNNLATISKCQTTNFTIDVKGNVTAGSAGGLIANSSAMNATIEDCSVNGVTYTNQAGNNYQGANWAGFIGFLKGLSADYNVLVRRNSVSNINITFNGTLNTNANIGGYIGYASNYATVDNAKATGVNIKLGGNINAGEVRIGGMIGYLDKWSKVTNCLLSGSSNKIETINTGLTFADRHFVNVGGVIGCTLNQENKTDYKIVIENCAAYCDIDLCYRPLTANKFCKNNFSIGGVVGRLYRPTYIPKTLFYSGKVNAPYAVVGPLVGTFLNSKDADVYICDDYSGENSTYASSANYDNWYYGNYQIYLNEAVSSTTKTKNGDASTAGYITIGDISSWTANAIGTVTKASKTILRYENKANYSADNLNKDKTISPQWSQDTPNFPAYYMYYAQGVNRGNYASNSADVTAAFNATSRELGSGLNWSFAGDASFGGYITTGSWNSTNHKYYDFTVKKDDGTDAPGGYYYVWKIAGVEQSGNSVTGSFEALMDTQAATVDIYTSSDKSNLVASLAVTIPHAEWIEIGADAHPSGSGTQAAPYLISTAAELGWVARYERDNTAAVRYYQLTADIDLAGAWWTPIGGIKRNKPFYGVFDGNQKTISNLTGEWISMYETHSYGLFGAIGGQDKGKAEVKNLNIYNAQFKHVDGNTLLKNEVTMGVLAGCVSRYSTVKNIVIKNSSITGAASFNVNGQTFMIGGAIGRLSQNANTELDSHFNIYNLYVDVDINLNSTNGTSNYFSYNVGGAIGQVRATYDAAWRLPQSIYYTGSIKAPQAAVGPLFANASVVKGGTANNTWITQYEGYPAELKWTDHKYGEYRIWPYGASDYITITDKSNLTANSATSTWTVTAQSSKTEAVANTGAGKVQGVNSGEYESDLNKVVDMFIANTGDTDGLNWAVDLSNGGIKMVTIRLVDRNAGQKRFAKHIMELEADESVKLSCSSYKWYVNGEVDASLGTTYTAQVVPTYISGKTLKVVGLNGSGEEVCSAEKEFPMAIFEGDGTSASPYLIGCKEELQMLSYLSNNNLTYNGKTTAQYNQSYYKMDNDINMSSIADFTPIGNVGTTATYSINYVFRGSFDGAGHTISGLNITWLAGDVNANDYYRRWGLFGSVEGTSSQTAEIKNLTISGATLKHKTDNTTFAYTQDAVGNHVAIGVLAGVVGSYTNINKVKVQGTITDEGTTDTYSSGKFNDGIYVGGLVGCVNKSYSYFKYDGGITNTTISQIVADVDVTLTKFTNYQDVTANRSIANVGGIVGRHCYNTVPATISKTLYSGKVNAPLFSVSPTIGTTNNANYYSTTSWDVFAKEYDNSTNDAAPYQPNEMYYADYQIHDGTAYKDINKWYPSPILNRCIRGARTLTHHTHVSGYLPTAMSDFQGVNFGTLFEGTAEQKTAMENYILGKTTTNPYVDAKPFANGEGTKASPYEISSAEEFSNFTYVTNLVNNQTVNGKNLTHYNTAYYKLTADIDLSGITNYGPACFVKDTGTETKDNKYAFTGKFDGQGHSISNYALTWAGGLYGEARTAHWGIFATVGGTESQATIQNLVIKNATFTHDASNTTFYFRNSTTVSNNVAVGILAGTIGRNTTIQNVEVSNSQITDGEESLADYDISKRNFWVGGVIGRAQYQFEGNGNLNDDITMRFLSADVDITLNNAKFQDGSDNTHMQYYHVGGILGSLYSNGAAVACPVPSYTYYTGKIKAPNATFVSPVIGYVYCSGITSTGYGNYCQHYMAKASATDVTIPNKITNVFYGDYQLHDDRNWVTVNETTPGNKCAYGARTLANSSTHNAWVQYGWQGVNFGAYSAYGNDALAAFADISSLSEDDQKELAAYHWEIIEEGVKAKLVIKPGSSLTALIYNLGEKEGTAGTYVLKASPAAKTGNTYKYEWYINGTKNDALTTESTDAVTIEVPATTHNQYVYCVVTNKDDAEQVSTTSSKKINRTIDIEAAIERVINDNNISLNTSITPTSVVEDDNYSKEYKWYLEKTPDTPLSNTSANYENIAEANKNKVIACEITVTDIAVPEDMRTVAENNVFTIIVSKYAGSQTVIYLNPTSGVDPVDGVDQSGAPSYGSGSADVTHDGKTPEGAVKTWKAAYSKLTDDGTWDDNVIVLMGEFVSPAKDITTGDPGLSPFNNNFKSLLQDGNTGTYTQWKAAVTEFGLNKNATITGQYGGVDYGGVYKMHNKRYLGIFADTRFENIVFDGENVTQGNYNIIFAQYNNLEFGVGIKVQNFPKANNYGLIANSNAPSLQIFGGYDNDSRFKGNPLNHEGFEEALPKGGFNITFKSGHFSNICAGGRQTYNDKNGIYGTPRVPVKCTITVDMDPTNSDDLINSRDGGHAVDGKYPSDYDMSLIMAGNHEGAQYGDVDIIVKRGRVARIVGGSLGAATDPVFTYEGVEYHYPMNAYMGRSNILLDPRKDADGKIQNEDILVTEIYNGGVGRAFGGDGSMINLPFYGKAKLTINGGTLGVASYKESGTDKYLETKSIVCGIFGAGAGGVNGIGDSQEHSADNRLPYWATNEEGGTVLYGDWTKYNEVSGTPTNPLAQRVKIQTHDSKGNFLEYIDPQLTSTEVVINGGVFGTSSMPIDGVYGGGSGFTSSNFDSGDNANNTKSGTIFGLPGNTVSKLTINGGTFYGNIYGAGRGTAYYYEGKREKNNKKTGYENYAELGKTFGNVEVNISGGQIYGNVYGAGAGVAQGKAGGTAEAANLTNMARLTGNSTINITGGEIKKYDGGAKGGNVYGGGMLAGVTGDVIVKIGGDAKIEGNVHGAAQGVYDKIAAGYEGLVVPYTTAKYSLYSADAAKEFGIITGNAKVEISGSPVISGEIYGGAESAIIDGNTAVSIDGGTITNVYGGGLGIRNVGTNAGNADANVKGTTSVIVKNANYTNTTNPYYIYGGGNVASHIGTYTSWTDASSYTEGTGTTSVTVASGIGRGQTTVYGAGYGAETSCISTEVNIMDFPTPAVDAEKIYALGTVYGGGRQGPVYGKASVSLYGGTVLEKVFGGGDLALVDSTSIYMGKKSAYVYGDIVGGGNQANVNGDTKIEITAGNFGGNIFGGGNGSLDTTPITSADITGNTTIYIAQDQGGQDKETKEDNFAINVIWNKIWDATSKTFKTWESNKTDFYADGKFLNPHNIYGGGNLACKVGTWTSGTPETLVPGTGTTNVTVLKGMTPYGLLATTEWKDSYDDNANPHFYVFGGGYGKNTTVANTNVTVNVEGEYGEYTNEVDDDDETGQLAKGNGPRKASGSSAPVFDNSKGIPNFTVLGALGGGYAGLVTENTSVTVDGKTFLHRVYGGGFGDPNSSVNNTTGQVGGNTEVTVQGAHTYGDVFGGGAGVVSTSVDLDDVARVLGTTSVTVADDARIYGNVFGGGDMANVGGPSDSPRGEEWYSSMPSSSSLSNAGEIQAYEADNYTSLVNVIGGDIFGEVFGGGKGVLKAEANDYTKVGRIEGNTLVHTRNGIDNDNVNDDLTTSPHIWNNIYGGGSYGSVDGNALVHIEGGFLGYNIYGGGFGDAGSDEPTTTTPAGTYANILGNTKVQVDGGTWMWDRLADIDGNITYWDKAKSHYAENARAVMNAVTDPETNIIDQSKIDQMDQYLFDTYQLEYYSAFYVTPDVAGTIKHPHFTINHNIYGGGNAACVVGTYPSGTSVAGNSIATSGTGTATVEANHSPMTPFYDGDDLVDILDISTVGGYSWYRSVNAVESPQFSIFGGGYGANTKVNNTVVKAQPGPRYEKDGALFDLRDGVTRRYIAQDRDDDLYLTFENSIFDYYKNSGKIGANERRKWYGSIDGTDNDYRVYLRYRASQLATSLGAPSVTFMDIHGGGFSGYVVKDADVITDNDLACRNVFGGGLGSLPETITGTLTGTGTGQTANDISYGQVGGNTHVKVLAGSVSLNVFGGGAGVASEYVNNNNVSTSGTLTDFPNVARVKGKAVVDIYGETVNRKFDGGHEGGYGVERTLVFGSVYGGGDVANVGTTAATAAKLDGTTGDYTTTVNIRGASILSQIYTGGNGRLKAECADYTQLGSVYGNTRFKVEKATSTYPYDGTRTGQGTLPPFIWNRVYGGCNKGTVYGNTYVELKSGYLAHNIFGGGYGYTSDSTVVEGVKVVDPAKMTSANVTGNTHVCLNGGEAKLSSLWIAESRTWTAANFLGSTQYSPQYDPVKQKFTVNHNVYAGGHAACKVGTYNPSTSSGQVPGTCTAGGETYITVKKGMLQKNTEVLAGQDMTNYNFFHSNEWKEVYNKVGSPHFCYFGGGYGENTYVNNTNIDVCLETDGSISGVDEIVEGEEHKHFATWQSVMDIVGGGYSGMVLGNTNVNVGENGKGIYARRVFGGGFYNSVNNSYVNIDKIDCHDIFGGGLMGDVNTSANVNIGRTSDSSKSSDPRYSSSASEINPNIHIHGNVYGANDVSGYINMSTNDQGYFQENDAKGGVYIKIYGGKLYGNVFGGGNGDYLYALDREDHTEVTVNEDYLLDPNDKNSRKFPLVYTVPMRETMPSYKSTSDAAKIVNINSWRPLTNRVNIEILGNSESDTIAILGDVYGGGNSATVQKVYQRDTETKTGDVTLNIGSNVNIGRVFMGCNGDDLFAASEDNAYLADFQKLNDLTLNDTIDWDKDPSNHGIKTIYLPTENKDRPRVYPHLLDLYFYPVEMNIQGELKWNGTAAGTNLQNCTIGTFCCGGNRGNMDIYPDATGKAFEYTFPAGLTITDAIIGGCNNANYPWYDENTQTTIYHEGGYLLGAGHSSTPYIKLVVKNKFAPKSNDTKGYLGGNVFGGCYDTGTVRGDVSVDFHSDMLTGKSKETLQKSYESATPALSVYGAGFGEDSFVYGDVNVTFGQGESISANPTVDANGKYQSNGTSAHFVYGGGQKGNVIGLTNVDILNGHVAKAVTGGSYSGFVYGSTQVKVGYPTYYKLKAGKSGRYLLNRTDVNNLNVKNKDKDGNETTTAVKQYVCLLSGDIVSPAVYEAIHAKYNGEGVDSTEIADANKSNNVSWQTNDGFYFEKIEATTPTVGWNNVRINIDEAIYGGGYSVASGSSVLANNTTVLRLTDEYNINDIYKSGNLSELTGGIKTGTSEGFAGNTTILVADATSQQASADDRDHITVSHQEMAVAQISNGTDLYGYYYKGTDGNYHYIYQAGRYQMGGNKTAKTVPEDMDDEDTNIYQFDSEGGIFGDGHLSYAEGFRNADLRGYGYASSTIANPKKINTFQRLDLVRLTDNCFTLLGARDYTVNEISTTPYSIARVGEVQMYSSINDVDANLPAMTTTDGAVTTVNKRTRNYMGFSNNIHFVGAVYSNVDFNTAKWHNATGALGTAADKFTKCGTDAGDQSLAGLSYQAVKQAYIDDYYGADHKPKKDAGDNLIANNATFQHRNDGTAKNMIGIASGYALKIQNSKEYYDDNGKLKEDIFYGPIYGVVEMNLIDVREDEGGGYVYADNIHKRSASSSPAKSTSSQKNTTEEGSVTNEDFLETTGNFVFPYSAEEGRHVVDDCFPSGYNESVKLGKTPEATADVHYWYVTGFNYFYNAHITGYTYNSTSSALQFDLDNADKLMTLAGAKKGQTPKIYSITWRSGHDNEYACDLETRNAIADGATQSTAVDASGNPLIVKRKYTQDEANEVNSYHLIDDTSGNKPGTAGYTATYEDGYTPITLENDTIVSGYNLGISAAQNGVYSENNAAWYHLPFSGIVHDDNTEILMQGSLPSALTEDASIAIRLTDKVDNSKTDSKSGNDYYTEHLSKPCEATIILTLPAQEDDGTATLGYIGIQNFYTMSAGQAVEVSSTTKITIPSEKEATPTYYYYNSVLNRYSPIEDLTEMYTKTGDEYNKMTSGGTIDLSGNQTYYYKTAREYTYTIYLTIDYVKGPQISGNITVQNCALSGEMIRVSKENVNVESDVTFAPDGYYWRLGKRSKDSNGNWSFVDDTPWTKTSTAPGYDVFKEADLHGTKGLFNGANYVKSGNCIDIPAYYFMNGYGIQLGVSMTGLEGIFPVEMADADSLLIHNYHRMDPGKSTVNLHLAEAVARAKAEPETFAEPRIYLSNTADLRAFVAFIDTVGTGAKTIAEAAAVNTLEYVKIGKESVVVPRYGANAQFIIQNDMEIPAGYDASLYGNPIFAGTVHGEGHVITGLATDKSLITTNNGNIYNLGMASGKIAVNNASIGDGYSDGKYHCCFEYNDGSENPRKVYRMDGTPVTSYSIDDFRYGKVAYDLNQYYLAARQLLAGADDNKPTSLPREGQGGAALKYIQSYWHNGDYQYARRSDDKTYETTGVTYLRTGTDEDAPNYGSNLTRHDTKHTIDVSRAVGYVAAHEATEEEVTAGLAANVGDDIPASYSYYAPLFNSTCQTAGAVSSDASLAKNDYIYWGQDLSQTPADYPATIASLQNSAMSNRVYRAVGYYGNTVPAAYHYNAYRSGNTTAPTYVHIPTTTAIDFTCQADGAISSSSYLDSGNSYSSYPSGTATCYYPPFNDVATGDHARFGIQSEVTRNLLVYTPANSADETLNDELYDVVNTTLGYKENAAESTIFGHHVTVDDGSTPVTKYLHLVERTAADKNAEGGDCVNNDFCVPVAFNVTDRAWYTRNPSRSATNKGYAESGNDAWEGICLPFTVNKVAASINGEITHFYGAVSGDQSPENNINTLHHEYWLRGLTDVKTGSESDGAAYNGKTIGTFQRPGLFNPKAADGTTSLCEGVSYTFANSFFTSTYGSSNYNSTANDWYANNHEYEDYLPLTSSIPYVVSFPGNRYYEFDLSSKFYNEKMKLIGSQQKSAQTVTFNAFGTKYSGTETANNKAETITIPVTTAMQTQVGSGTVYSHIGTFAAVTSGTAAPCYAMNTAGTAFEAPTGSDKATIMPFRTYMTSTASASSAKSRSGNSVTEILIGGTTAIETIEGTAPEQTHDEYGNAITIYAIGKGRIQVTSDYDTTLKVFTPSGQLYRLLDVRQGTATYSGFQPGVYVAGGKKLRVQ